MSVETQNTITVPTKKDKMADPKTYINIFIGVLIMFGGQHLPTVEPLTEIGVQVIAIFVGTIYLWITVETLWSSLLAIVALGLSDYTNMSASISSFGNDTVILVLFSMIYFGAIADTGVVNYISRWFLTRKISNGHPYVFSYIYIFGVYVIASLTSCFSALLLSWPIAYTIIKDVGYTKEDSYAKFLVFGTFIGSILGHAAIPFRGTRLMLINAFNNASGQTITFPGYIVMNIIMAVLVVLSLIFLCKYVYRCDVSNLKKLDVSIFDQEKLPPMTKTQKFYFYSIFIYMLAMLAPSLMPVEWPIVSTLEALGPTGTTIVLVVLLCVLRIDNKQVINFKPASKHVNWGMLFLIAVAISMSSALTSETTGVRPVISAVLDPLMGGSPWKTAILLILFAFIFTNFSNNVVIGIITLPILGTYAAQIGMGADSVPIAVMVMLSAYFAFLTPAASPYAAMLFANRDWVTPKEILKFGIPMAIIAVFLYAVVGYQIAKLIF